MLIQIGSGGVGFWLAVALARAGVEDHIIYDDDTLTGGLGYTRLPQASLGTKKVQLLNGFCVAVMGTKKLNVYDWKFDGLGVSVNDLVVDCSDMDLGVRTKIYDAVKASGARYLRVSYDGLNETVVVAEGLPLKGRKGGGYAEKPNLGLSFMAGGIGSLAVLRILNGWQEHVEFQVSLADFFGAAQHIVEVPLPAVLEAVATNTLGVDDVTALKKHKRQRKAA